MLAQMRSGGVFFSPEFRGSDESRAQGPAEVKDLSLVQILLESPHVVRLQSPLDLTHDHLVDFLEGRTAILQIGNLLSSHERQAILGWMKGQQCSIYGHEKRNNDGTYTMIDYGVRAHGEATPFNKLIDEPDGSPKFNEYASKADAFKRSIECLGIQHPFDKLAARFSEVWQPGMHPLSIDVSGNSISMGIGLLRSMLPSDPKNPSKMQSDPHVDSLIRRFGRFDIQWGVNIFLEVPESGGELAAYIHQPFTQDEIAGPYLKNKIEDVVRSSEIVGTKPEPGSCVIVNNRLVHFVRDYRQPEVDNCQESLSTNLESTASRRSQLAFFLVNSRDESGRWGPFRGYA
jgi:hypothetical protein